ncbi:hypothetical protein IEQ34_020002 [Dendrobium chrysotoxum]|uniref:MADS-box domain-containing protein n=1 Tax=Dendrobium chrysotoxum TaxID=161865 RepID=A0AAV7GBF9_DENCH|nr:hypothetical protein IEQ34_020002 [Dendrobium chrysotoxum]
MSFLARTNDLFEKAYHLSVLCDAEVALIIFSDRGKLYEFGSAATNRQVAPPEAAKEINTGIYDEISNKHSAGFFGGTICQRFPRGGCVFDEEVLASRIVDQVRHNVGGKKRKSKGNKK